MNEKPHPKQDMSLNSIVGKMPPISMHNVLDNSFKVRYPTYHTEQRKYMSILSDLKRKYSPKQSVSCNKLKRTNPIMATMMPTIKNFVSFRTMEKELSKIAPPRLRNKAPIQALLENKSVMQLRVKDRDYRGHNKMLDLSEVILEHNTDELNLG